MGDHNLTWLNKGHIHIHNSAGLLALENVYVSFVQFVSKQKKILAFGRIIIVGQLCQAYLLLIQLSQFPQQLPNGQS